MVRNIIKILLVLALSGCSIPLRITTTSLPPPYNSNNKSDQELVQAMACEPFWQGQVLGEEYIFNLTRGYSYATIDKFVEHLKVTNPNTREDVIDDWIKRVKVRYKLLGGE